MRAWFLVMALLALATPAGATPVDVSDLDSMAEQWSGQEVTIRGEIVGDYSPRGEVVWVQVNDDPYADRPLIENGDLSGSNAGIGVRIPVDVVPEGLGPAGGYHTRGPLVEITGTFRYADPDTGGDTFVDARSVTVLEAARDIQAPPAERGLLVAALVMVAAGAGLWARARWRLFNPKQ